MSQFLIRLKQAVPPVYILLLLFNSYDVAGQRRDSISLQEAYDLAATNFPFIRQKQLIRQTETMLVKNADAAYLPQLTLNGQASYQSDVTRVEIPLPGVKLPAQAPDQYKITADLNQVLYDAGQLRTQKAIQQLNTNLEESRLEVDIYQLTHRISQLFFNIIYQDALLKQTSLVIRDVQIGLEKLKRQVEQAVVLRSNLQVLEVQLLQLQQKAIEIRAMRKGLTDALSLLTNQVLDENTVFLIPAVERDGDTTILRPELKVFQQQTNLLLGQLKMINVRNKPRASVFVQGGYGRPALNLLSNAFDFFYIGGLRLNWQLGGLYNKHRDKQLIDVNRQMIELQKEVFLLNTSAQLKQLRAEISKYRELVETDEAIIALRNRITEASKAQLENAVITASDYLREVNAADLARQALATHQLQLLQAELNYRIISGKL